LTDGVALLRADGHIIYANEALCALARRKEGFCIVEGTIEFTTSEVRRRLAAALDAVARVCDDPFLNTHPTDFLFPRDDAMPAYIVAVRPIARGQVHALQHADATVMLLIHEPFDRNIAAGQVLREMFGLTSAEVNLAQALCAGMTTGAYSNTRRVSLNTVYT